MTRLSGLDGATDFDALARISEGRTLRGDVRPRLQPPSTRSVDLGEGALSFRVVHPWNNLPLPLQDCDVRQFPACGRTLSVKSLQRLTSAREIFLV